VGGKKEDRLDMAVDMGSFVDDLLKLKGGNIRERKAEAGGRPKRPGPK
jgi:hypothetical protein